MELEALVRSVVQDRALDRALSAAFEAVEAPQARKRAANKGARG